MRLIDADAIHISITGGRMNGKVEFAKAIEEAIKEAPTIEAIPVDWMMDYTTQKYGSEITQIDTMIDEWRKEDETD